MSLKSGIAYYGVRGSWGGGGYLVAALHLNLPDRVIDKILNLAAGREW